MPPEFFNPPKMYDESDINSNIIIHNHLATQDQKLTMIGHAINRIYEDLGYTKGVLGILKRIIIAAVLSAVGYTLQGMWLPILEALAKGKAF